MVYDGARWVADQTMKINPPASSSSPTSRKKPRIMPHLISVVPGAPPAINGAAQEIQPHQHLISAFGPGFPAPGGPEGVDAARRDLYKTGNGGGRNPAAAVL